MRIIMAKIIPLLLGILLVSASVPMAFGGDEADGKQPVRLAAKAMSDEELSKIAGGGAWRFRSLVVGGLLLFRTTVWTFGSNLSNRIHSHFNLTQP